MQQYPLQAGEEGGRGRNADSRLEADRAQEETLRRGRRQWAPSSGSWWPSPREGSGSNDILSFLIPLLPPHAGKLRAKTPWFRRLLHGINSRACGAEPARRKLQT